MHFALFLVKVWNCVKFKRSIHLSLQKSSCFTKYNLLQRAYLPWSSTLISTPSCFGWPPLFILTHLNPSIWLMMCNYLGVCVRWKLISLCRDCWQAWHECSCPGRAVCHPSETLWVDIRLVMATQWQSSGGKMTLWLFLPFRHPKEISCNAL